jgi:hypothetical protein
VTHRKPNEARSALVTIEDWLTAECEAFRAHLHALGEAHDLLAGEDFLDAHAVPARAVRRPERKGFGSLLIETSFGDDGESCIEFRPDGLRCVLELPL